MVSLDTVVVQPWDVLKDTVCSLAEGINSPRSLMVYLMVKYQEHDQLARTSFHPLSYIDPFAYRDDACVIDLVRKSPHIPTSIDREAAAWESSVECETKCAETNQRIRQWVADPTIADPEVWAVIRRAQDLIADCLGEFSVEEWLLNCKFGPGSFAGSESSVSDYDKFNALASCTAELAAFGPAVLQEWSAWYENQTRGRSPLRFEICNGEKFSVVRKTALTDRTIGIQPLVNGWFQSGIGLSLRARLNKRRLLLPTAQEFHRRLAREASERQRRNLATLDQSNASNLIASAAVRLLLGTAPAGWLHSMELTRCKSQLYKGEEASLHRFSSMGNAYTFELETLIFWALAKGVMDELGIRGTCSVFGDDTILPNEAVPSFFKVISFLGFEPNVKKSFSDGQPFRESCGGDYFDGVDVRSFFSKEELDGTIPSLISLANGLRRLAHRRNCSFGCDIRLMASWNSVVKRIPSDFRRRVAFGFSTNDDLLLASRCKGGKKIMFKLRKHMMTGWFAGKATILYRNRHSANLDARPGLTNTLYHATANKTLYYSGELFNNAMIASMVKNANYREPDSFKKLPSRRDTSMNSGKIFNWKRDSGYWVFTKDKFSPTLSKTQELDWF